MSFRFVDIDLVQSLELAQRLNLYACDEPRLRPSGCSRVVLPGRI